MNSYVDALGHTASDWIVDAEPQAGVAGHRHQVCAVCGERLAEEIIDPLPVSTEGSTVPVPIGSEASSEHSEPGQAKGCKSAVPGHFLIIGIIPFALLFLSFGKKKEQE